MQLNKCIRWIRTAFSIEKTARMENDVDWLNISFDYYCFSHSLLLYKQGDYYMQIKMAFTKGDREIGEDAMAVDPQQYMG